MKQILSLLLLLFFLSSHAQEEVTKLWVESFAGTDAVPEEMRLLPLDVSGRQQMRSQSPQIRALLKLLTEKVLEGEIPAYSKDDLKSRYVDLLGRREALAQKTQYVSEDPLAPLCNNMRLGQFFEVDSMSGAISKQTVWIELLWDPDPGNAQALSFCYIKVAKIPPSLHFHHKGRKVSLRDFFDVEAYHYLPFMVHYPEEWGVQSCGRITCGSLLDCYLLRATLESGELDVLERVFGYRKR